MFISKNKIIKILSCFIKILFFLICKERERKKGRKGEREKGRKGEREKERKKGRKEERKKERKGGRETSMCGCHSHTPNWAPGPPPWHVP